MAVGDGFRYGPMLIGTYLNCILYGVTIVQTFIYFRSFKSDKRWIKIFVLYLLFCETLNTLFEAAVIYDPLILGYGTPRVATTAPRMLAANPIITVMISFPVQLFIAWRVKIMSRSYVLPGIIFFFSAASFAGGLSTSIILIRIRYEYDRFHESPGPVATWLAASALADVIITASLVSSLMRKRTGFSASDDVINRVIRLTLQTGLVTAVTATLDITLYLLLIGNSTPWNFVLDFMLSKLYANTVLSSLNARTGWKATSTMRDNILFGHGTSRESMPRDRTQVEIMATVVTEGERSPQCMVPMKVLNSEVNYSHDDEDSTSAVKIAPAYVEAV